MLLAVAFEHPVIVVSVANEFERGVALGRVPAVDWTWLPTIDLSVSERVLAEKLEQALGKGEAASLALAATRQWLILTDDRNARRAAYQMSVSLSGTLGILVKLVQDNKLGFAEGERCLQRMIRHGYRCPVASLSELMGN